MLIFFFISKFLSGSLKCQKCELADFLTIHECHKTGWLDDFDENNSKISCVPNENPELIEGIKTAGCLFVLSLSFTLLSVLRKKCLLSKTHP